MPIIRWSLIPRWWEKAGRAAYAGRQRDGGQCAFALFYNRVKGEMEEALIAQQWPRLTIARPSMLIGEREKTRRRNALCAAFQSAAGKSEVNRGAGRGERATRGGAIAHAGGRTNSLFVAAARKGGTLGDY